MKAHTSLSVGLGEINLPLLLCGYSLWMIKTLINVRSTFDGGHVSSTIITIGHRCPVLLIRMTARSFLIRYDPLVASS